MNVARTDQTKPNQTRPPPTTSFLPHNEPDSQMDGRSDEYYTHRDCINCCLAL